MVRIEIELSSPTSQRDRVLAIAHSVAFALEDRLRSEDVVVHRLVVEEEDA